MYQLSRQGLSESLPSISFEAKPNQRYPWRVVLYHSSGGIKRDWFIGQDTTPIKKITFELNKRICGAGSIEFIYVDFPINADDYVVISYNGTNVYRAILDVAIDPKGGKSKLVPYTQRFQEVMTNDTFSDTAKNIFEDLITDSFNDTKISWNTFLVNTGSTETLNRDYTGYSDLKKAIEELTGTLDDREYGVNADNFFTVYTQETDLTESLLYGDDPAYAEIKVDTDYSKVSATRFQVFKKVSGAGEAERIGEVGYGGLYPTLEIEKLTRKKEKKFNVSELITSTTEALEMAYANLQANAVIPTNIKLKEVRLDKYFPVIGDRLQVQDRNEIIRRQVVFCDSLTNDDDTFNLNGSWSGATLDTTDFTDGSASVKFTSSSAGTEMSYSFGDTIIIKEPFLMNFMIKSNFAGNYIELEVGEKDGWSSGSWSRATWSRNATTLNDIYKINIASGNVWQLIQIPFTDTQLTRLTFRFSSTPPGSSTVKVDNIGLFMQHREVYEANVVKASFTIDQMGAKCDVSLNDYDVFANDDLFRYERKIAKLEEISQDT